MKILILTLPLHINYGGILQAFALQKFLELNGHQSFIVSVNSKKNNFISYLKYTLKILLFQKKKEFISYSKYLFYVTNHSKDIDSFIHNNMNVVHFSRFNEINYFIINKNIDTIIVGSDQVWRSEYTNDVSNYFLSFLDSTICVNKKSYAASFGLDEWKLSEQQTNICRKLLSDFSKVSVREESGFFLCQKYFGVTPQIVLDPTLLLMKEDYIVATGCKSLNVNQKRLFSYILDSTDEKEKFVESLVDKYKLIHDKLSNYFFDIKQKLPSVESWLLHFYLADCIVTDSYHGCVFSIIFNKRFIAINNSHRGSGRFISLLKSLGLQNRLVLNIDNSTQDLLFDDIDWNMVNHRLKQMREHSSDFLDS